MSVWFHHDDNGMNKKRFCHDLPDRTLFCLEQIKIKNGVNEVVDVVGMGWLLQ